MSFIAKINAITRISVFFQCDSLQPNHVAFIYHCGISLSLYAGTVRRRSAFWLSYRCLDCSGNCRDWNEKVWL